MLIAAPRRLLLSLTAAAALGFAAPANAAPIVDVLSGSDGNFTFSVVHTSSSGFDGQSGSILGSLSLGAGGGDWSTGGGLGTLNIDLDLDVGGAVSSYAAVGVFDLARLVNDATNQANVLLGSLAFTSTGVFDTLGLDGITFYFEDRSYSSAGDPPNALRGNILTLWGATEFTGTPTIGSPFDLKPGGFGIDLRVDLGPPIPEPSARPLFLAGIAIVGFGAMRMRRANAEA